jgi:hypothetical protein
MNRRGTGGDEDFFPAQLNLPVRHGRIFHPDFRDRADLDGMRVKETAPSVVHHRVEPFQLLRNMLTDCVATIVSPEEVRLNAFRRFSFS